MKSEVAPPAAMPDPSFGRKSTPTKPKKGQDGQASEPEVDPADLRLVIEEDEAAGTYVYRTIDRRTGEVVQELAREDVVKLGEDDGYVAGGVIRAKA